MDQREKVIIPERLVLTLALQMNLARLRWLDSPRPSDTVTLPNIFKKIFSEIHFNLREHSFRIFFVCIYLQLRTTIVQALFSKGFGQLPVSKTDPILCTLNEDTRIQNPLSRSLLDAVMYNIPLVGGRIFGVN